MILFTTQYQYKGLRHWADSFFAQDDRRDEAIVLIDPDFLFLNQFELPEEKPDASIVMPGIPFAAKYGLGGQVREYHIFCHYT